MPKLKNDGSNFTVWHSKIKAAMRNVDLQTDAEILDPVKDQLGLDILVDVVEDALIKFVDPPPGVSVSTFKVLQEFRAQFGQTNKAFHGTLISQLWQLAQKPGESIQDYGSRSSALLDQLLRSGGDFPSSTFLECFGRGLSEQYELVFTFLEQGSAARQTYSCLMGDLLAAEAKLGHKASLKQQQFHGAAGAVTETRKRPWKANPKPAAAPPARAPREQNPNCWNCNQPGHSSKDCPQPQVRPWPFVPAGFVHKPRGAASAAGSART
jgi:hypothetical protein